jgi:hypothetical protein
VLNRYAKKERRCVHAVAWELTFCSTAYNARAKENAKPAPSKGGKTVRALVREWSDKILPNRKPGGARAALSHIQTYILPLLGELHLQDLNLSQHQSFVTAV